MFAMQIFINKFICVIDFFIFFAIYVSNLAQLTSNLHNSVFYLPKYFEIIQFVIDEELQIGNCIRSHN